MGLAWQQETMGQDRLAEREQTQISTATMVYLRTFQCCRIVLVLGWILLHAACASRQPTVAQAEDTQVFPEVRQITFRGNTHFSSGTLRKLMATQQRPLFPRGDAENRITRQRSMLTSYASKNTTLITVFSKRVCVWTSCKKTLRSRQSVS